MAGNDREFKAGDGLAADATAASQVQSLSNFNILNKKAEFRSVPYRTSLPRIAASQSPALRTSDLEGEINV
ncbi:MAG: hypothetical protein K2Z80_14835 [Xanthobacteraceae bacterium]|nr:hypothetical protein [Xanthobacteraceae bacterium]